MAGCRDDSGGPMFCHANDDDEDIYLAGIISGGPHTCSSPSDLVNVGGYLDWINFVTNTTTTSFCDLQKVDPVLAKIQLSLDCRNGL